MREKSKSAESFTDQVKNLGARLLNRLDEGGHALLQLSLPQQPESQPEITVQRSGTERND